MPFADIYLKTPERRTEGKLIKIYRGSQLLSRAVCPCPLLLTPALGSPTGFNQLKGLGLQNSGLASNRAKPNSLANDDQGADTDYRSRYYGYSIRQKNV
jgi:hypothetical protein